MLLCRVDSSLDRFTFRKGSIHVSYEGVVTSIVSHPIIFHCHVDTLLHVSVVRFQHGERKACPGFDHLRVKALCRVQRYHYYVNFLEEIGSSFLSLDEIGTGICESH